MYMNYTLINLLTFGLFWSIFISFTQKYLGIAFIYHLAYFAITCYTYKIMLKSVNNKFIKILKQNKLKSNNINKSINSLCNRLHKCCHEISNFNTLWSISVLCYWIISTTVISCFLTAIIFSNYLYLSPSLFRYHMLYIQINNQNNK